MNLIVPDMDLYGTIPDSSWISFWNNNEIKVLWENISETLSREPHFPDAKNILRFQECNLEKAKVVILGMEPYPSSYKDVNSCEHPVATGRSFEIAYIDSWAEKFKQTSMWNILKALYYNDKGQIEDISVIRQEIEAGRFKVLPPHEWFDGLEKQGVIFLNATLTTAPGVVGSHKKLWEEFMTKVIEYMVRINPNLAWFIWGNEAKERVSGIVPEKNMIRTSHPRVSQFVEENCFQYKNDINWLG